MQLSCRHAEVCRVSKHVNFLLASKQESILREADIVADADSKRRVLSLKGGKLGRARNDIATFKENDLVRNIDIEKVMLAMMGRDSALLIKAEASVVDA